MTKEELKQSQPVAWKILSSALKSKKINHAYLLHGPKGAPLSQMALLFAQSLECPYPDEDGFACQTCSSCRRMAAEETPDFFWLHRGGMLSGKPMTRKEITQWWNEKQQQQDDTMAIQDHPESDVQKKLETAHLKKDYRIRKEDVLSLQDAFSNTPLEGGKQVYILEEYDKATPEASNSLLKFFEEPKADLYGILTSSEPAAILPTILSRAQMVPFRPASRAVRLNEIAQLIEDTEYAEMLADAGYNREQTAKLMENVPVFEVQEAAYSFWQHRTSAMAVCELQLSIFKSRSASLSRETLRLFFSWLLFLIRKEEKNPDGKTDLLSLLDMRMKILESLDALARPVDLALLADRTCFEIMKLSLKKAYKPN